MTVLRFGLTRFAQSNADWYEKAERAEQCGFDVLWAPDHLFHFQRPDEAVLDGWVTVAAWAAITTRIRIGTLITNLSWRSPVLVARAAAAIDQVSGGRFELGLGAGAFDDQAMAGVLEMPPGERVARLAEGAAVIDRLLRGDVTPFAGRFTRYEAASMAPGCVQVPRPPITIAANGDLALRVAARYADVWNTWGGLELPIDEFFEATVNRSGRLDQYCTTSAATPRRCDARCLCTHGSSMRGLTRLRRKHSSNGSTRWASRSSFSAGRPKIRCRCSSTSWRRSCRGCGTCPRRRPRLDGPRAQNPLGSRQGPGLSSSSLDLLGLGATMGDPDGPRDEALFREHCLATPAPMSHLRIAAGIHQPSWEQSPGSGPAEWARGNPWSGPRSE